jgi:two-component system, sensor histidine kinase and response regulator
MELLQVLVVDDEVGIRSGISRILKNFSVSYPFMDEDIYFKVTEAATGEEAMEIIESNPPAIILLDNKLPGIQGVEILEFINNNQLDILVIMITSFASLDLAVKVTNIGAFDFVPKPFTPLELKIAMESVAKHYFLRRMTKKLHKEGKQVRFQFLTVLSHELKSPLNTIESYLKIMHDRQEGDSIGAYEKMIEGSLSRVKAMRTLIMDLLDLTRIDSDKKNREYRELDLGLVAQSAIETMIPLAVQRDVEIEFDKSTSVLFLADSEDMEIIFNNLISNAIKYNVNKGKVVWKVSLVSSNVNIEISDTGIGISETDIPKLFQEFTRIKNSKTKEISGSGLGLSIVKRIIDIYNGQISVKSKPDVGTTFIVSLPISLQSTIKV